MADVNKIKSIKIKQPTGTYSNEIPIGVDGKNVDLSNGMNIEQVLGNLDVATNGSIAEQIQNLKNNVAPDLTGKQDTILDLEEIRRGAALGASALQNLPENVVEDAQYVHTDNNFTDAQKTKVDAIPNNYNYITNVSELTNDSGFITDAYHDNTKQNKLVFNTAYDSVTNKVATMADIANIGTVIIPKNKTYTAKINLLDANSETCLEYQDDALGKTKASSDWDSEAIFKDIKPCILKDGQVQYYLNPENFNQKIDGTVSNLDGTDGDVMIEFPKFAYKIWKDSGNEKNDLYVSITTDLTKEGYHAYAFSKEAEGDRDYFYWGACQGSLNNDGNLQSVIGQLPAHSKTIGQFKECANRRGTGYTITSYFQLVAIQCLYIIRYGDLNGQKTVGNGVSGASAAIQTGGTETNGMFYGTTKNNTPHVKVFGIEDFWGNIWEWIDGLTIDSSRNIVTTLGYGEPFTTPSGLKADSNGWVKNVSGTTESGFMCISFGGSQTTYFCDYGTLFAGRVLRFGGAWNNGAYCGPFGLYANYTASNAYATVGARLMFL